jgi:two-component system response regulator YesN
MAVVCKAMIVDDEEDMVALIAMQIELANHGMLVAGTATDGEVAVELMLETLPDVIVLDYLMPSVNGLELAEKLLYARPEQNIVLFSAFITEHTEAEALRVGIRKCVLKSRIKELPEILRRYCPAA